MPSDAVLIVGGGPGGLEAAANVLDLGGRVVLVEKHEKLGGTPIHENYAALTPYFDSAEEGMQRMIDRVVGHPNADVRTQVTVASQEGSAGDFRVALSDGSVVEAGAVIVATGFQHFDPGRETQMYGYYEHADVIALQDLESMLKDHNVVRPSNGEKPKRLCFIQCVGSRDRRIGNEYCSKVCCGVASKEAIEVRQQNPDCKVFIFYIDMRMYGYWENQIYWPAQEQYKVQYVKGIITEILPKDGSLLVRGEDTTMGRPMEVPMDIVVLSVGMEPSKGTREMAGMFEIPQNKYGFIETAAPPLDTVTTAKEGVFVCGAAVGPADLEDTISSAGAAASKAVALVRRTAAAGAPA
ncbi:MAG TPA: FAD-dependent oxidoreductase [Actinomycetota bacterium]